MALRSAVSEDMRDVWSWNNDPAARAVSLRRDRIDYEEHREWYRNRLADADSVLLVVEVDGVASGVLRVQRDESGAGVVSIALAESARGRGIGQRALRLLCERPSVRSFLPLEAWIQSNNDASRRCFEAVGFRHAYDRTVEGRTFAILRWYGEKDECAASA